MKVTETTKSMLAFRRQKRELLAQGYRQHETDWQIHRGGDKRVIVDAVVSADGMYVYTLLGDLAARV